MSFAKAQAFADPDRLIAEDLSHGSGEPRYYCFGWVDGGVMTVRSRIVKTSSESSAPAIGAKASQPKSENVRYTDERLGRLKIVPDFLPRPEDLVFRDEGVKVTIALSKRSVEFFKDEARKHHTQYQRMIRRLLDAYAEHHSRPRAGRSSRTRVKAGRAG